jgi:hypothetical protein
MNLGLISKNGDAESENAEIQRGITIAQMTPEKRAEYYAMIAQQKAYVLIATGRINAFKNYKPETLTQDKTTKSIEYIREKSLADNWVEFFRMIPARELGSTYPVTKFRFIWGPDGKPVYVPMTLSGWENYFGDSQRGRWIQNVPFMYVCGPEWVKARVKENFDRSQTAARKYPNTDPRHLYSFTPSQFLCRRPTDSFWVTIRKPLLIMAVIVTGAVFLGPALAGSAATATTTAAGGTIATATGIATPGIVGAAGGATIAATAGTGAAVLSAATTTSLFSSIQAGTKTLLGYVNKARTVDAIIKGELPPPPIGISGSSFTDWAMIVAKDLAIKEAKDLAAEKGIEYIQRKMTEREEAKLRAEIELMQRQLDALIPKDTPIAPSQDLAPEIRDKIVTMQDIEKGRDQNSLALLALATGATFLLTG